MPRHSPFDWIARVIMLVLAGMVSLSIIGAIAAIPSGSNIEGRIGIERPVPAPPEPFPGEQAAPAPADAAPGAEPQAGQPSSATLATAPAAPEVPDPARWLEAITYALLALVGLSALGALILWRGLSERRRIADALEILAARR